MKTLIAYDGSICSDAAIRDLTHAGYAVENEVLVVTVANDGRPSKHPGAHHEPSESDWEFRMKEAECLAESARLRIQQDFPGWKVTSEPLWGDPAKTLLKTIEHWNPDVIVLGSHGRSAVGRLVLGSVSLEVVNNAPCSVRVSRLRMEKEANPARILIASDGSEQAEAVIQEVARRRWPEGTEARVVCILETLVPAAAGTASLESNTFATEPAFQVIDAADKQERVRLQMVAEKSMACLKSAGLRVTSCVIEGNPRDGIIHEANDWHAGTVFVGARGMGVLDRFFLGSISNAVVTHAHCTVEVVRHGD